MRAFSVVASLLLLSAVIHAQSSDCGTSSLGYACAKQITSSYTLHWSVGPSSKGANPKRGEVAMAVTASTTGWVGIAFAQNPGVMNPADSVIGWVTSSGASVNAYKITTKSVSNSDKSDQIGIRAKGGSETGGVTTIRFILTGTFTFAVDLKSTLDMNWAMGTTDSLTKHTARGSFTIKL